MNDSSVGNPLLAQMRESGLSDVDIARADAMLGLLAITRKTRRRRGGDPAARALEVFFEFALPLAHQSQSQIMQDLWVLYETGSRRGGYFVEFGAGNGVTMSNTAMLEKGYGWTGILAEPNPAFHARLGRERSVDISHDCVHAVSGAAETFLCTERPAFSRLAAIRPDLGGKLIRRLPLAVDEDDLRPLCRKHQRTGHAVAKPLAAGRCAGDDGDFVLHAVGGHGVFSWRIASVALR